MKNLLIVLILACQIYTLNSQNLPAESYLRKSRIKRMDTKTQTILTVLNASFFAREEMEKGKTNLWQPMNNPVTSNTQQKLKPFGFKNYNDLNLYKFIENKYEEFKRLNILSNEIDDINNVNVFQDNLIRDIEIHFPKTVTIFCKIKRLICVFCPTKQSD